MLSPDAAVVLFVVALELFADLLRLVDVEVNVARGVVQPVCNLRYSPCYLRINGVIAYAWV